MLYLELASTMTVDLLQVMNTLLSHLVGLFAPARVTDVHIFFVRSLLEGEDSLKPIQRTITIFVKFVSS
jgi:hypothetical protein